MNSDANPKRGSQLFLQPRDFDTRHLEFDSSEDSEEEDSASEAPPAHEKLHRQPSPSEEVAFIDFNVPVSGLFLIFYRRSLVPMFLHVYSFDL